METSDDQDSPRVSRLSSGSEEDYSLVCVPCNNDNLTILAFGYCTVCKEHMCHNCYKYHQRATLSKHHKLLNKDAMPTTQQLPNIPEDDSLTDSLTTPCPYHKREMIKIYCHDHQILLCSICAALEHTKPCHVDYIPEISEKMVNSSLYNDTMNRIDELLNKCTMIKTKTAQDIDKSNNSLKTASEESKKYRQEINKRLDELEEEIETKIQVSQHDNDQKSMAIEGTCEHMETMMKQTYDNMKQLKESEQPNELFIELIQAQTQLQDYENSISPLSEASIYEYKFIPSQAIIDILQGEKMIGDISTMIYSRSSSPSHPNLTSSVVYENITPTHMDQEICVKTPEDEVRCNIGDMTALSPDRLVLTDWDNNSIKLLDTNSKSIISQLSLGKKDKDKPGTITSTSNTQVAVNVPQRQHIQFITVTDQLSMSHTVSTNGECFGICCCQDKLIVTYPVTNKLKILDMKGKKIRRVKSDELFRPRHVQANSTAIFVSHKSNSEIIKFNWEGEIIGKFIDLPDAGGLAHSYDDSLLICCYKSNKVCQVSVDFTTTRIILKGVRHPKAVCVDQGGCKFYISRLSNEEAKTDNNILVYNMNTSI